MTDLVAGPEQRLNPTRAGNQRSSQIAGLAGGGYAVVWQSDALTLLQVYDASGAAIGEETPLYGDYYGYPSIPKSRSITALADGGFVVTWVGSEVAIYAQIFDATGAARTDAILANPPAEFYYPDVGPPAVAAFADGGFGLVWTTTIVEDIAMLTSLAVSTSVQVQRLDATGEMIAERVGVYGQRIVVSWDGPDEHAAVPHLKPAITTLADGGFVVAWQNFDLGLEPNQELEHGWLS